MMLASDVAGMGGVIKDLGWQVEFLAKENKELKTKIQTLEKELAEMQPKPNEVSPEAPEV